MTDKGSLTARRSTAGGGTIAPPQALIRSAAKHVVGATFHAINVLRPRRLVVFSVFPDLGRKSAAIAALLRARGFPVDLCTEPWRLQHHDVKTRRDLYIGFWNRFELAWLPRDYVFFNGEPLNHARWGRNAQWMKAMRSARAVWDYNPQHGELLARQGIPARYIPFGYAPHYEETYRASVTGLPPVKDIDVLFYGSSCPRRETALDRLRDAGMNVATVTRANPAHGRQLDALLARTKVVLSIHQFDTPLDQTADLARLDYLLSNGIFVLQEEPGQGAGVPDGFAGAVATYRYSDLVDRCAHFLARPAERAQSADAARAWFKARLSLDNFLPYGWIAEALATPPARRARP